MYRIGRGVKKSRRQHLRKIIILSLMVLLCAGLFWLHQFMNESGDQSTAPVAITREYAPTKVPTKTFDAPEFHMELPPDWVLKEHQTTPHNLYAYQAGTKGADNRWLEIYVDSVPERSFNRVRPVRITGGVLIPTGQISDNCYEAAGARSVASQTFAGIVFQCDLVAYSRNVVGIGAPGQGTSLKLANHRFMIVYIDHNVRPDYQILDNMLKSFSVK
jgi:hypothetical protein